VRLGAPRTRAIIDFDTFRLVRKLQAQGIQPAGAFASLPNEFWDYSHLGENAHFFFVLRQGRGGARMIREAVASALLDAYEMVYRQLALRHPDYEPILQEIEQMRAELQATFVNLSPTFLQGFEQYYYIRLRSKHRHVLNSCRPFIFRRNGNLFLPMCALCAHWMKQGRCGYMCTGSTVDTLRQVWVEMQVRASPVEGEGITQVRKYLMQQTHKSFWPVQNVSLRTSDSLESGQSVATQSAY